MRTTLPCHRLCMARAMQRGPGSSTWQTTARTGGVYLHGSSPRCQVPVAQRRFLTLPDLSKLSPFGPGSNGADKCETYHEKVTLPFAKSRLFDIVSNVDEYQSFVPYCVQSDVDSSSERQISESTREFLAELAIGYGSFRESYTSKVTIVEGESVQATAIPTPLFERLETLWTFSAQSDKVTEVDFTIHYAFANPFYAAFAKSAIEKMTGRMVEAFKIRAEGQQQ